MEMSESELVERYEAKKFGWWRFGNENQLLHQIGSKKERGDLDWNIWSKIWDDKYIISNNL